MKVDHNLPFEIGQQAEAKSFIEGYRGAWFRCKIVDYGQRGVEPVVALDYLDYIDYKKSWTKLYRLSPAEKHNDYRKRHLMLRPRYPQIYLQSQMPDISEISEMVAIVDGSWEVGDLVDWFEDGCYWSAWITEVIDEENVQIQLPKPPLGEGGTHKVPCKDLRPMLDWDPKLGWSVPIFEVGNSKYRRCVRLIHPMSPGKVRNKAAGSSETSSYVSSRSLAGSMPPELSSNSSGRENLNQASPIKIQNSSPEKHSCRFQNKQKTDTSNTKVDGGAERTSLSDSSSGADGDKFEPVLARKDVTSAETPDLSLHSRKRIILERYSHNLPSKEKTDASKSIKDDGAEKTSLSDSVSSTDGDKFESVLSRNKVASAETPKQSSHSRKRIFLERHSFDLQNKQKTDVSKNIKDDGAEKTSLSDKVSSTDGHKFEPVLARKDDAVTSDCYYHSGYPKKMRKSETELSLTSSNTIESSLMDLEVLIKRVKWLKGALTYGIELSDSVKPWKFLETRCPLPTDETVSDL